MPLSACAQVVGIPPPLLDEELLVLLDEELLVLLVVDDEVEPVPQLAMQCATRQLLRLM
jgi:hypothetical protein